LFKNFKSILALKPVLAVAFLFAVSSLLFGSWVAAIPAVKERFQFTDAGLGLSLLLSPLGAITGVLISTRVFSTISAGKWMLIGYLSLCVIMLLQINAVNKAMLWGCLYAFGIISFLNGVASNAVVSIMEKKYNRLLMSSCHALYSLGGAISAGLAVAMMYVGIVPGWQIIIISGIIMIVLMINKPLLLAHQDIIHSGAGLQLPSLSVLGISFICMILFMAEGCVADWSGIYFKEVLNAPKEWLSLGYGGFALAMTVGRLNGDAIVAKTGSKKTVVVGCMMAALGFAMVVLANHIFVALAGYVIIGLGCSGIVPILFRASAAIPGLSRVEGFAMVTTGGLIGFLAGPSLIGFLSEKTGLAPALSLLILLTILAAAVAWKNPFLQSSIANVETGPIDEQLY